MLLKHPPQPTNIKYTKSLVVYEPLHKECNYYVEAPNNSTLVYIVGVKQKTYIGNTPFIDIEGRHLHRKLYRYNSIGALDTIFTYIPSKNEKIS